MGLSANEVDLIAELHLDFGDPRENLCEDSSRARQTTRDSPEERVSTPYATPDDRPRALSSA